MEEFCEKIPSQKRRDKINVRRYLMVKEKTHTTGAVNIKNLITAKEEQLPNL